MPQTGQIIPPVAEIANEAVDFNKAGHATASQRPHRLPVSFPSATQGILAC